MVAPRPGGVLSVPLSCLYSHLCERLVRGVLQLRRQPLPH